MEKTKKVWKRPQLIILERGTPEEAVLVTCKGPSLNGPPAGQNNCQKSNVDCIDRRPS